MKIRFVSQFVGLSVLLLVIVSAGCTAATANSSASTTTETTAKNDSFGAYYYGFDDVLVPTGMDLDKNETFVVETMVYSSGVMSFKGKLETISLRDFFVASMPNDGWVQRSAFKSRRSILVFEKPGKFCIISISENQFTTFLEIWIAPTQGNMPVQSATTATQPEAATAPDEIMTTDDATMTTTPATEETPVLIFPEDTLVDPANEGTVQ